MSAVFQFMVQYSLVSRPPSNPLWKSGYETRYSIKSNTLHVYVHSSKSNLYKDIYTAISLGLLTDQ